MKECVLSFDKVGIAFKRKRSLFSTKEYVLKDISFDLLKGETLGVIGRNGAGKSTLLKLLADLIKPNSGTITRPPGIKSQLLSLNLGFNKNLSGRDNAIMALVTQGMSIRESKNLISKIGEYGSIPHLMDQPVGTYSAGERARLGFSIAIHSLPEILLLDEILGVGDKEFRKKSSEELKQKVNSDQTVVLVSHSTATLKNLCDRVMWIESGRVKMLGDAQYVVDAYMDTPTRAAPKAELSV
ncbi:ATP-binding cassette domain-containing protein [Microbulbifer agarilyticus]|uniref:ABC transporter ATP-binding protein n=1 Tax=Microbulbifer agarilyticus TaxID=260552 RepID=UPI001C963814|nr:ATP-binding cassette domain-containing protein [Microbulbifer agarilyticus]MBY6189169.1 ATP-binding cassette domain-containing protein [Microbulbifer agarilyticus]